MPEEESATGNDAAELPLFTPRRLIQTIALILVLLIGIYFLFPKLVGLGNAMSKLGDADPTWIVVAVAFNVLAFATYIALFKAVVGGRDLALRWSEAYEINMAGLAATLLFSAAGAGGVVLTYWALRKAGMRRRDVVRRMIAFLALHYAFYPVALIAFGILLRTGVLSGEHSVELTVIPAGVAGLILVIGLLVALIPPDLERRIVRIAPGEWGASMAKKIAPLPTAIGDGFRYAFWLFTHPSRGGLAVVGAAGFWAANIGILWAAFHAFGVHVPLAVVIQGFFLGMVANLFPLAPAGVGAVDAGMIGAFVLFGLPEDTVFPAILIYRLIAFWMPIPPGIVAFFQLRTTVQRWEEEGLPIDRPTLAILQKVKYYLTQASRTRNPIEDTKMSEPKVENVIIVGGGPAGYTAALYTSRANLEPLVFEGFQWGGQLQNTTDVENYPGFPDGIMGPEMMGRFRAQAERFGTRFVTDDVDRVELSDGGLQRVFLGDEEHLARAVILAMGAEPRRLGIPGEMELVGRGVSTCGVCDGAFFQDQRVIVIGGGDSAMEDSIFISKYASRLTVVHRRDEFRASKIMLERAQERPNIDFKTPYVPEEFVAGDDGKLKSVRLRHAESGAEEELEVDGAFVAIGHIPTSEIVRGQVDTDKNGYVLTRDGSTRTNLGGVFAIGDLVDHTYRQAITAAGTGCMGALDAEWYLRDTPPSPEAHWMTGGEPVEVAPTPGASTS